MKKTLILFGMAILGLTSLASSSMAADAVPAVVTHNSFDFWINGRTDMGNIVYYNCDSVETFATDMLTKMGAKNISVNCHGGIETGFPLPTPSVNISFDSIRLAGEGAATSAIWNNVKLRGFDNCHLAKEILKNVQDHFEIRDLKGTNHCSDTNSNFRFEFSTLTN